MYNYAKCVAISYDLGYFILLTIVHNGWSFNCYQQHCLRVTFFTANPVESQLTLINQHFLQLTSKDIMKYFPW